MLKKISAGSRLKKQLLEVSKCIDFKSIKRRQEIITHMWMDERDITHIIIIIIYTHIQKITKRNVFT